MHASNSPGVSVLSNNAVLFYVKKLQIHAVHTINHHENEDENETQFTQIQHK